MQAVPANPVAALQHSLDGYGVFRLHAPEKRGAGMGACAGIGNIKDIPQTGRAPGIVHQRNALGAAPDVSAHRVIPQVIFRTGRCFRALGVNHQLVMERIFVKAGSGV
uniref:hypothetical protein n=1 Tax=Blautia marasmi TaxID=1917868 RepID=UPI001FA8CE06|nr:hypothetical protein [Blautia marasmi]